MNQDNLNSDRSVSRSTARDFLARAAVLVEPILLEKDLELFLTGLSQAGGRPIIRLFVERRPPATEPVSLADCASVSRALERALEMDEGPKPADYILEISSPGLDRPLLKLEDCFRFQGRLARLKLRRAGTLGVYRGRLTRDENGRAALLTDSERLDFDWPDVVSGRLLVDEAELTRPRRPGSALKLASGEI